MGFDPGHLVLKQYLFLWVSRILQGNKQKKLLSMMFPLLRHNKSDYLKVNITSGSSGHTSLTQDLNESINDINIVQYLNGEQLWWLLHVRMGCHGAESMTLMFDKATIRGLPSNTVAHPSNLSVLYVSVNYLFPRR